MGEGTYRCEKHGLVYPNLRPLSQLQKAEWEVKCPACGAELDPVAMAEDRPLMPTSIYGQSKMDQELACLMLGRVHRIPTVAFRYFCVYGPRQSLSNPYTGVIARFATRLAMNKPPLIYEDGLQRKDPIHVRDVVRANLLAMERNEADYQVVNVGSGCPLTILDMAHLIGRKLGKSIEPVITGKFRGGDARHGWADISRARALLGWKPSVSHEEGIAELCTWLAGLPPSEVAAAADTFARLEEEAERKGLAV
jgi:dTDP-L-rhamnose 4-epimerase